MNKKTAAKVVVVRQLHGQGKPIAEIARVVGLTRQTIYRLLGSTMKKGHRMERYGHVGYDEGYGASRYGGDDCQGPPQQLDGNWW
jgi:predicted transcriptional regulator